MNTKTAFSLIFAASMAAAQAQLVLTQASFPTGTRSLFSAHGTYNVGNNKARLEAFGQTTVQGGNPANGWWGSSAGTGGPKRSWEVIWNHVSGVATFNVYNNADYTGLAMSMTRTPSFLPGHKIVGIDIGTRLTAANHTFKFDDIEFNGGSGFVAVPSANATYSGNAFYQNYHALSGPDGSFTLRGTAQYLSGSVTSDGMRWFVDARQAVPEPATLLALGAGAAAMLRRRSKK